MISLISLTAIALSQTPDDAKIIDLKDGYCQVQAATYTIEVPKGWEVSGQTPWGQRTMTPQKGSGELGVMTAPPGRQTWDELYQTSLYFIRRESDGKPTPYRITKMANGLEAASFELLDKGGFAAKRYVLIKDEKKGLLALSVKVPSRDADKEWTKHFDRMIRSAKFK
jgi:hypothetical protein